MDVEDFIPQYIHSRNEEQKEKLWQLYGNVYPNFDEKSFLSFEQFYSKWVGNKQTNKKISSNGKSNEELVAEAESVLFGMEFVEKS